MFDREVDQCRTIRNTEFFHDPAAIGLNCFGRQAELTCDCAGGRSRGRSLTSGSKSGQRVSARGGFVETNGMGKVWSIDAAASDHLPGGE